MSVLGPWLGAVIWLVLILGLILLRERFETWLLARFQGRSAIQSMTHLGQTLAQSMTHFGQAHDLLVLAIALLSMAILPLTPRQPGAQLVQPGHVLGQREGSLVLALALHWIGAGLLALDRRTPASRAIAGRRQEHAIAAVTAALPAVLVLLTLALSTAALSPQQTFRWDIARLLEAQQGWRGFRWMGAVHPLALIVWSASMVSQRPQAGQHTNPARQALALSQAMLAVTIWFGGWQGPLVHSYPWLGVPYTLAKVGAITLLQIWNWASRPPAAVAAQARSVWTIWTPLATLSLLITAWSVLSAGRVR